MNGQSNIHIFLIVVTKRVVKKLLLLYNENKLLINNRIAEYVLEQISKLKIKIEASIFINYLVLYLNIVSNIILVSYFSCFKL